MRIVCISFTYLIVHPTYSARCTRVGSGHNFDSHLNFKFGVFLQDIHLNFGVNL